MLSGRRAYTNSAYNYYINSQSKEEKKSPEWIIGRYHFPGCVGGWRIIAAITSIMHLRNIKNLSAGEVRKIWARCKTVSAGELTCAEIFPLVTAHRLFILLQMYGEGSSVGNLLLYLDNVRALKIEFVVWSCHLCCFRWCLCLREGEEGRKSESERERVCVHICPLS